MKLKAPWRKALGAATAALTLALSTLLPATSVQAAPAAGTVIGNQASATYLDGNNTSRTTTSNLVQTTVQQVKSFTLTADGARTASPGQTVYYPHVITNTGNGNDTYALNAASAGGTFTHTGLAYYADANGDGVPDNAVAINTTGVVAAGAQFRFLVAAVVPGSAALNASGTITVSVSDTSGAAAKTNTDTTTVAASAITVTKNMGVTSGPSPNTNILVTLAYTNSGTASATNLVVTDTLPSGMSYVGGSGLWGAQVLSDTAADPAGINYVWDSATGKVTITIDSVPAGGSGQVTFRVNVNPGLSPTNSSLGTSCTTAGCPALTTNAASYVTSTQTVPATTNSVIYLVQQTGSAVLNGSSTVATSGAGEPVKPTIAGASDFGAAPQGSVVSFPVYAWNTGNGSDTLNITLSGVPADNTFPAGTTFQVYRGDGTTPLIDTNGDGIVDTGPLASGANAPLVVKATLPSNSATGTNGGNGFTAVFNATSVYTPSSVEPTTVKLGSIVANTVDATIDGPFNAAPPAIGQGAGDTTSVQSKNVTPAQSASTTTMFRVYVNNTGAAADSYNLSLQNAVPTGWTVKFYADGGAGNCSTIGAEITSTGSINAAAARLVCAVATVPSIQSGNAGPGTKDLQVKVQSASTTLSNDLVTVQVSVQTVHAISLSPNGTQQTYPAAAVTYNHTLANIGNVAETVTFASGYLSDAQQAAGWTSTAYLDQNGNGVLDLGTDVLIASGSTVNLAVGGSQTIFVRVFAPASATSANPADVTTLTATYNTSGTATATDTTGITEGLLLVKEQVSTLCNVTPSSGYSINPIVQSSATEPGKCIGYRITATNTTAQTITVVSVSDNVPANTTLNTGCGVPTGTGPSTVSVGGTATATGNTGTVTFGVASLAPNASFTGSFCVQINP